MAARLLRHLQDEQWEIVGALERRAPAPKGPPSASNPLTVGSLIGR